MGCGWTRKKVAPDIEHRSSMLGDQVQTNFKLDVLEQTRSVDKPWIGKSHISMFKKITPKIIKGFDKHDLQLPFEVACVIADFCLLEPGDFFEARWDFSLGAGAIALSGHTDAYGVRDPNAKESAKYVNASYWWPVQILSVNVPLETAHIHWIGYSKNWDENKSWMKLRPKLDPNVTTMDAISVNDFVSTRIWQRNGKEIIYCWMDGHITEIISDTTVKITLVQGSLHANGNKYFNTVCVSYDSLYKSDRKVSSPEKTEMQKTAQQQRISDPHWIVYLQNRQASRRPIARGRSIVLSR